MLGLAPISSQPIAGGLAIVDDIDTKGGINVRLPAARADFVLPDDRAEFGLPAARAEFVLPPDRGH